jgi:signal transduction histidine kinase
MPERPEPVPADPPSRLEDIRRAEQTMVQVRWAAVVFATVQVLAYDDVPYPPGFKTAALLLVAGLGVANVGIWILSRRRLSLREARRLSVAAMGIDVLLASGFVWVYTFDPLSALWAVLFILPLEGAIRFGLAGALSAWAAATALYVLRELWGSREYGYPFLWNSVTFRMGIGFFIALVAGLMARSLLRQRAHLEGVLGEARRIDALRARMVATLAHDVRNPLTTIRGTLHTLARHGRRLDEATQQEIVTSADHQAERLERLATDLLDLARLEVGRLELHLEESKLRDVVDRALSFADPERRFDVQIQPDLTVRADPGRLEQVVVNLANNALRYGRAPLVVAAELNRDGRVDLEFRDHGPGVPEAERPALFEPFRAEADGTSVGLGLAIVRALVEAHGGEVTYEPNRPSGAVFRVSLPAGGPDG